QQECSGTRERDGIPKVEFHRQRHLCPSGGQRLYTADDCPAVLLIARRRSGQPGLELEQEPRREKVCVAQEEVQEAITGRCSGHLHRRAASVESATVPARKGRNSKIRILASEIRGL